MYNNKNIYQLFLAIVDVFPDIKLENGNCHQISLLTAHILAAGNMAGFSQRVWNTSKRSYPPEFFDRWSAYQYLMSNIQEKEIFHCSNGDHDFLFLKTEGIVYLFDIDQKQFIRVLNIHNISSRGNVNGIDYFSTDEESISFKSLGFISPFWQFSQESDIFKDEEFKRFLKSKKLYGSGYLFNDSSPVSIIIKKTLAEEALTPPPVLKKI